MPKIKLTNKARIRAPDPSGTHAEHVLADLYKGGDPEGARRDRTTLREALEDYVKVKNLRARSIRDYRHKVETYLSAWLDCPLQEITGEMVKVRHRDIAAEIEKRHRAAVKATAERYSAWAQQAEARGWLEAAALHRAAAAAVEVRRPPSGCSLSNSPCASFSVFNDTVLYPGPEAPNHLASPSAPPQRDRAP
jgi:hypothetical protein